MNHYTLQADEVVLFKGQATFDNHDQPSEVLLTNLHLVRMTKEKKMFSRDGVRVETFPVREVKTYNQVPQVKQLGGKVELYTLSKVMLIDFGNILTARKFVGLMYELLTGQTAAQRGADKVLFTPEKCIQAQFQFGSDVMMALDVCTHPDDPPEAQRRSGSLSIPAGLLKKPGTLQVWLVGEHKLGRLKLRKDIPLTE